MSMEKKSGSRMEDRVAAYMEQFHMVLPGEKILIGLSGGADSVCLFFVLLSLRERFSFEVEAVHVNHGLRQTAERDERFVQELCDKEGVRLHLFHENVALLAKERRLSLEEAGREVRYSIFADTMQKTGAVKIAVAHHADDSAETILFRLSRGTGIEGICGIRPVRDFVIRPLLCVDRVQIEEYLSEILQEYMTDETNDDIAYARNRIRKIVMPALSKVSNGASKHIASAGESLQPAFDYLQLKVKQAVKECVRTNEKAVFLSHSKWNDLHEYLQGELIRECIFKITGSKKDIGKVHIDAVKKLIALQVGSKISLPYETEVMKSYEELVFYKKNPSSEEEDFYVELTREALEEGVCINLPDGRIMSLSLSQYDCSMQIPQKTYTKWLDYDKIDGVLAVRYPQKDDFFYFDDKNKKYVKDYMVNEKIPLMQRNRCVILAGDNHMLYMVDKRMSAYVKIEKRTKKILKIKIIGGNDNGRENPGDVF